MDKLIIHKLEAACRVGVTEEERAVAQPIWIDLELPIDAQRAAAHDELRDSLDYARVVEVARRAADDRAFRLLETLAEVVASTILREFEIAEVTVRVRKRALPGIEYAAVEITRRHEF